MAEVSSQQRTEEARVPEVPQEVPSVDRSGEGGVQIQAVAAAATAKLPYRCLQSRSWDLVKFHSSK